MPEGHTIHRLARDLTAELAGQALAVSSPQGRFAEADALDGAVLVRASAIGKHLFLHFTRATVHVHLGLFGRFRGFGNPPPAPEGALRLRLGGQSRTWDLRGPTACELMDDDALAALRARLGADPLADDADPSIAWGKLRRSHRPIGAVLLDQRVFAGIGNVYRAELLFMLGLHPETPANTLTRRQFDRLWALSRELLARGVRANRIVTRRSPRGARRGESLHIYKQTTCRACGATVARLELAARTIYACETCQPRP